MKRYICQDGHCFEFPAGGYDHCPVPECRSSNPEPDDALTTSEAIDEFHDDQWDGYERGTK